MVCGYRTRMEEGTAEVAGAAGPEPLALAEELDSILRGSHWRSF